MNVNIRKAIIDDLQELQILFTETIISTCKEDYDELQIAVWTSSTKNTKRWNNIFDKQFVIVAEIEDKIVGFGSLENGNYIDFMYVHKDYLRKGIANRIYIELKNEAQRLGCDKLNSDVSKTAIPFFESKDFKIIKENRNIRDGIEIINYHMSQ